MKNNLISHDINPIFAIGQGDDYATGCNYDKMIAIDLSKQQALDANPKAIQQISFTGNLDQAASVKMFFIIEETTETVQIFHKEL